MSDDKKRVLIGIDGSVQSMNAAGYISGIMPPDKTRVVLYHVDAEVMDLYFDVEDKPDRIDVEKASYSDWIAMRKKNMATRLEKIRDMFIEKGFPGKDVEVIVREIEIGVTRDIIEESRKDYDILVVGKTGVRCVTGITTGSVTGKLISKVFHIPMIVVEGRPETNQILAGFDASKGSISAVRGALGFTGPGKQYNICHVIRSMNMLAGDFDVFSASMDQAYYPEFDVQRVIHQKKAIEKAMKVEKDWMISQGVPAASVQTTIMEGYMSRSQALTEKARKEGYGTLVLGRRGHSAVLEFFMGRVGRKVIQMCDTMAVWIMN